MSVTGRALSAVVAAGASRATYRALTSSFGSQQRWTRTNYADRPVSLAAGPAVGLGSVVGVLANPRLGWPERLGVTTAIGSATGLGLLDDLTGATSVKGLSGHLRAFSEGEVTTGFLKLAGLGVSGLASGLLLRRGRGGLIDGLFAGAVVAGAANLVNLFDLRPGRASKVVIAASAPSLVVSGVAGDLVASPVGATLAMVGDDLREQAMLGDAGANALGAGWGAAMAAAMDRRGLVVTVASIAALTLASEKVSFSDVISRSATLRRIDDLGRGHSA